MKTVKLTQEIVEESKLTWMESDSAVYEWMEERGIEDRMWVPWAQLIQYYLQVKIDGQWYDVAGEYRNADDALLPLYAQTVVELMPH